MRIVVQDAEASRLLHEYVKAQEFLDLANQRLKEREQMLLDYMEDHHQKTVALHEDGHQFSATYTVRSANVVDEKGLRKALTARVYDRYTVKKLDRKRLEQAMSDGSVDPRVVAKYVVQVPGKSFLTYRVKEEDGTEGLQVG